MFKIIFIAVFLSGCNYYIACLNRLRSQSLNKQTKKNSQMLQVNCKTLGGGGISCSNSIAHFAFATDNERYFFFQKHNGMLSISILYKAIFLSSVVLLVILILDRHLRNSRPRRHWNCMLYTIPHLLSLLNSAPSPHRMKWRRQNGWSASEWMVVWTLCDSVYWIRAPRVVVIQNGLFVGAAGWNAVRRFENSLAPKLYNSITDKQSIYIFLPLYILFVSLSLSFLLLLLSLFFLCERTHGPHGWWWWRRVACAQLAPGSGPRCRV